MRTRSPSVTHCGIKLLKRFRDNLSTAPLGLCENCSFPLGLSQQSFAGRAGDSLQPPVVSLELPSFLLSLFLPSSDPRRRSDNSEYGHKRRHMLDTCAAVAVATVTSSLSLHVTPHEAEEADVGENAAYASGRRIAEKERPFLISPSTSVSAVAERARP